MPSKKKSDFIPHMQPEDAMRCAWEGCAESGVYKAPRSRDNLYDYCWYCLDHVREHNKQWDYFEGMDAGEIEHFMKEAVTGHRPTWSRESALKDPHLKLHEALDEFLGLSSSRARRTSPQLPAKLRKALALMDIEYPYSQDTLKKQYRGLVKKFHPDANQGNKEYEEKFKQITTAYHYLSEQLKVS